MISYAEDGNPVPLTVILEITDRQYELSIKVILNELSTVATDEEIIVGGDGIGTLNVAEVSLVKPFNENTILALLTGPWLEALNPVYVAIPFVAETVVVPFSDQEV